jgi:hypothetical protein
MATQSNPSSSMPPNKMYQWLIPDPVAQQLPVDDYMKNEEEACPTNIKMAIDIRTQHRYRVYLQIETKCVSIGMPYSRRKEVSSPTLSIKP